MSSQIAVTKTDQAVDHVPQTLTTPASVNQELKVFIPYDGSENAEATLDDLRKAGLPQNVDALIAVTNVWLPCSPYEITRAVRARRMRVLTAGASSFTAALREHEEQRVLSFEADRRIRSIFPAATIRTEALQDVAAMAREILRRAKAWGADLIIVGSKVASSPHITDYAEPALKVAQDAHCSVRIARASHRKSDSPMQIMIVVEEPQSTAHLVETVTARLWPAGSKASLVAVRGSGPRNPARDSATALALERGAERLRGTGLEVSIDEWYGQPPALMFEAARELSADCIFIAPHAGGLAHGDDSNGHFSKAAEALVLAAPCSVEVVRARNLNETYPKPAA